MTKRRENNMSEPKFNSFNVAQQNNNLDISMVDPDHYFATASRGRDKNNITDINDSFGSLDYDHLDRSVGAIGNLEKSLGGNGPFDEPTISNFQRNYSRVKLKDTTRDDSEEQISVTKLDFLPQLRPAQM